MRIPRRVAASRAAPSSNEKEICLQFLHELNGVSFSSIQHRKAGVSGASYLTDVQPGRRIGKESAYGGR